jgi:hypothetical protein
MGWQTHRGHNWVAVDRSKMLPYFAICKPILRFLNFSITKSNHNFAHSFTHDCELIGKPLHATGESWTIGHLSKMETFAAANPPAV